jgi:hypothetical protein
MLRSFVWLWISAVCSVAVGAQVIAVDPATATAITPSVVNCEPPTDLNRVSASSSEAALLAELEAWWRQRKAMQKKALSQMEAWWRERTEQPAPAASTAAPPTTSDAIAQMEVWWRQRGGKLARKSVLPAQHRRHKGYEDQDQAQGVIRDLPTEIIGPNEKRELTDDQLRAFEVILQRPAANWGESD